jgi:hypothetical protein
MVIQENVTLIVTTCNLVEKGVLKCEKFWPDVSENFAGKSTSVQQSSPEL